MRSRRQDYSKSLLRNRLRSNLKRLSSAVRRRKSAAVRRKLLALRSYREASVVFAYVSRPDELDTRTFIRQALLQKKRVVVPKVRKLRRTIELYEIRNLKADLRRGAYGILEPKPGKNRRVRASSISFAVIPGLGFDRQGRRLGRGLGYFDRLIKRMNHATLTGVAFKEQMCTKVPAKRHDQKVDKVLYA